MDTCHLEPVIAGCCSCVHTAAGVLEATSHRLHCGPSKTYAPMGVVQPRFHQTLLIALTHKTLLIALTHKSLPCVQTYLAKEPLDDLVALLSKARVVDRLLEFMPPSKRSMEDFSKHFGWVPGGLVAWPPS